MALLSAPVLSSPCWHLECHVTSGLGSTFAPQKSSKCIGVCYSLLSGCHNHSYFSLCYVSCSCLCREDLPYAQDQEG